MGGNFNSFRDEIGNNAIQLSEFRGLILQNINKKCEKFLEGSRKRTT